MPWQHDRDSDLSPIHERKPLISLSDINATLIAGYEAKLRRSDLSLNTRLVLHEGAEVGTDTVYRSDGIAVHVSILAIYVCLAVLDGLSTNTLNILL